MIKDKLFDTADEIDSPRHLKEIIEEIFFNDETVFRAIKACYMSMPDRI